jgi:hypothetical protein
LAAEWIPINSDRIAKRYTHTQKPSSSSSSANAAADPRDSDLSLPKSRPETSRLARLFDVCAAAPALQHCCDLTLVTACDAFVADPQRSVVWAFNSVDGLMERWVTEALPPADAGLNASAPAPVQAQAESESIDALEAAFVLLQGVRSYSHSQQTLIALLEQVFAIFRQSNALRLLPSLPPASVEQLQHISEQLVRCVSLLSFCLNLLISLSLSCILIFCRMFSLVLPQCSEIIHHSPLRPHCHWPTTL